MMGAERNPGQTRKRSIDEVKIYRRVGIKTSYLAAITLVACPAQLGDRPRRSPISAPGPMFVLLGGIGR